MIVTPSTERASGSPLRSRMSPRAAGSTASTVPAAAAISAYALGSSPCSCTRRAPKTESTIAITTKPSRSRNSGEPRMLPRGRWVRAGRVVGTSTPSQSRARSRVRPVSLSRSASVPASPAASARAVAPCGGPGREHLLDDGLRRQHGGLGGRTWKQSEAVGGHSRCRLAEHLAGGQLEVGRLVGGHHAHALGLLGDPLGVAEHVELHLQGLLAGREGLRLLLQRGRRERRLLHGGVEEQQPDDAAQHQHRHEDHERHLRGPGPAARDHPQPRALDRRLAERGDPGAELDDRAAHRASSRSRGPREPSGRRSRFRGAFMKRLL